MLGVKTDILRPRTTAEVQRPIGQCEPLISEMPKDDWSAEETDDPLYADRRNFR